MAANYLHGVETITLDKGPVPVNVVKSGVIGLVGIAPTGDTQIPILVKGVNDASQFGKLIPGFNIPRALDSIFKQGAGSVIVVNVFDPIAHTSVVTNEAHTVANGKLKLSYAPIGAVTIKESDGTTNATIVKGTDYTLDEFGNFVSLTSGAENGHVFKFNYRKLNAAAVTSSVIIGAVDSGTNAYTGIKAWALSKNMFGFNPKILIAPDYSSVNAVATELIAQAETLKAVTLLDAPYGTTQAQAIAGRGVAGTINFNTSSKRAFLLYPYLKAYDADTDTYVDYPYSSFMAGIIAATDNASGYWYSPSNKEIKGITGAERNITASLNDAGSDANVLNEAGITTIFNTFGTGIRTWGNRSASFPTITAPDNFLSVIRTADVIHESLENAVLQFIDQPITPALIDAIRETCNSFIRILIGRGALITGSRCEYPADVNTPEEIAAGHLTFDLVIMTPVPGERITFRSYIDISLLKNLS